MSPVPQNVNDLTKKRAIYEINNMLCSLFGSPKTGKMNYPLINKWLKEYQLGYIHYVVSRTYDHLFQQDKKVTLGYMVSLLKSKIDDYPDDYDLPEGATKEELLQKGFTEDTLPGYCLTAADRRKREKVEGKVNPELLKMIGRIN